LKVIIIGAGEVGFHIASRFALENKDVVVIDTSNDALKNISESIDVQVINGSGSSPTALIEAGIEEAEILFAVTNSDETNLVACLMTNLISPAIKKLARIRNEDYDKYHDILHDKVPYINTIINPDIEVVNSISRLMNVPGAEDVGEFANGRLKLIGFRLDLDAKLAGVCLSDLAAKTNGHQPLIAAIIRKDNLIIPMGTDTLKPGDLVYFISESDKYLNILSLFDKYPEPIKRVLIVGGGRAGLRLALLLEEKMIYTKIIEKDADRCIQLADRLNKSIVLHGDGSDQELLREENIKDMDTVVTLTNDDETNILVSLLVKKMGVKTITKIGRFSYLPLMPSIGIEQVVSSRLSAINTILQYARRGRVLSAISIKGEQAEALEAEALESSDIVGKPLKNVQLPKGSLVIGIMRGADIIIPSGESVIHPGDRIIIFARREVISKIEKILTVKLEYF